MAEENIDMIDSRRIEPTLKPLISIQMAEIILAKNVFQALFDQLRAKFFLQIRIVDFTNESIKVFDSNLEQQLLQNGAGLNYHHSCTILANIMHLIIERIKPNQVLYFKSFLFEFMEIH